MSQQNSTDTHEPVEQVSVGEVFDLGKALDKVSDEIESALKEAANTIATQQRTIEELRALLTETVGHLDAYDFQPSQFNNLRGRLRAALRTHKSEEA